MITEKQVEKYLWSVTDLKKIRDMQIILHERWKRAQAYVGFNLHIGDKVTWKHKGPRHYGKVAKINRRTVKVITDDGIQWTVTPSLLEVV